MLVIAFLILTLPVHAQTPRTQPGTEDNQPTPTIPAVAQQQSNGPNLQGKTDTHVSADVRVVSAPSKDVYDRAALCINVALALFAFVGIGTALKTLQKLERQTNATEAAVKAALTQANHIVTSERPWLMVEWEATRDGDMRGFSFNVTNWGKSPAKVTNHYFQWDVLKSYEAIENLPQIPFYKTATTELHRLVHPEWVAPSKSMHLYQFSSIRDFSDNPDWEEILVMKKLLVFMGFVSYTDTFTESSRITRFCYLVVPESSGRLKMIGPNSLYNEHT